MTGLAAFGTGFVAPYRGLVHLVRRPALWPWTAIPVAITLLMLCCAAWGVYHYSGDLLALAVPRPMGQGALAPTLRALWRIAAFFFATALFVALFVTLEVVGTAIAGPFHDRLSARVEAEIAGHAPDPSDWGVVVASIAHSLLALALYVVVMVPLFALNIVPVLGELLYLLLGTVATSMMLARQMFDYPLSRHRASFADKLRFVWRHRSASLGLGLSTTLLLMIPLLNLVSLSISVIGGTMLFCALRGQQSDRAIEDDGG